MPRKPKGSYQIISTTQQFSGYIAAVLPVAADRTTDPNLTDILTNLGSYGRKLYGQGLYGNQR